MSDTKGIAEDLQGRVYSNAPVYSVSREKIREFARAVKAQSAACLLYTSPSPRDRQKSRMPSSA